MPYDPPDDRYAADAHQPTRPAVFGQVGQPQPDSGFFGEEQLRPLRRYAGQPYAGHQPTPAPAPTRTRRRLWPLLLAASMLFLGVVIGTSRPAPAPQTVAGPERVITSPSPVAGPEVPVTPPACVAALDYADQGLQLSGEALQVAADAFTAISEGDIPGLQAATAKMSRLNAQIGALSPKYKAASAQCRAER